MFGISNFNSSEKSSWYNMADVLASPLSIFGTSHPQLSQALSMSEVDWFCAFENEFPIL